MSLCNNALVPYVNSDCVEQFAGGVSSLIFFQTDLPVDPSSASEVQALLDSGDAILVEKVKVGMPEASPITAESTISCSPEITVNYDRTITLMDGNVVSTSNDFYNSLNATSGIEVAGALLYECDADRCTFIDKPINFTGGRILPNDNTDTPQNYMFTGKFKRKTDCDIVDKPGTIFN
jgi:hypothetical protein